MEISGALSLWLIALACAAPSYILFSIGSGVIIRSREGRIREVLGAEGLRLFLSEHILARDEFYLLSMQVGMLLSAIIGGIAVFETCAPAILSPSLSAGIGEAASNGTVLRAGGVFVFTLITLALVQFLKGVALTRPEKALSDLSLPLIILTAPLLPIVLPLYFLLGVVFRGLGIEPALEREILISAEEISEIVDRGSERGTIRKEEKELIQGVVSFSDTVVREVMVPRKDIVAIQESAPLKEVLKLFIAERLSRILVIGEDLDDVRGMLILKDLLPLIAKGGAPFDLKHYMRPPHFVPNTKKIDRLLQEMRQEGIHLAVVLDEHGGVDGLVTIEDLIEEIVGEISDEFDSPADDIEVYQTKSGDLLVDGSMLLDDLNNNFSFHFPTGEYDTIAGFLIHHLGVMPKPGEIVEYESLKLKVERMSQNRILLVRILGAKRTAEVNAAPGAHLREVKDSPESPQSPDSPQSVPETPPKIRISGSR